MKLLSSLKGKTSIHKPSLEEFPLLPLRELVLFPHTLLPVFITYKAGMLAIDEALRHDMRLFAACLKLGDNAPPETYPVGTVVRIVQHLKLPDTTFRIILQGEYRASIVSSLPQNELLMVRVSPLAATSNETLSPKITALMRAVQNSFAQYAEFSKKINTDTILAVEKTESIERLSNLVCHALIIKAERKVELLGIADTSERLESILEVLELENEIFGIQKNINGKVKTRMEKTQREYILHEQLKEINRELGKEEGEDEFADLERAIEGKAPHEETLLKARKELTRLRKLQPFSPEAGVLRGYLEWIADLPWNEYSNDAVDLAKAEGILDEDHFGMHKPKERIIEFIAVHKLITLENANFAVANLGSTDLELTDMVPVDLDLSSLNPIPRPPQLASIKGPILCFVGPPGTGKTSLGQSVARSLGRRFVRVSLGGVRDEAEIRGHRKTYVGALPGKIIQAMRRAETINPVFLLDEIDKLSHDVRGDPASALLEVLDPEQNATFTDHYLELPYDLSKVLFITTANSLHGIPYPLLDRMEIIEIPGYGENEKLAIAKQFLVPKEINENGLGNAHIAFTDGAIRKIVRHWTMESGVRSLEREIARCVRRVAREAVNSGYGNSEEKDLSVFSKTIDTNGLEKLLGRRKFKNDLVFKEARIGVSYGLAWTETGGALLPVESIRFAGNGEFIITGNLGDVMKESARIALSYLQSARDRYNFTVEDISKTNFHIHVPEGAIPKDGPSAGITLAASLLSTLCQVPPKAGVAMTGELTLTGRILPIGGLKEKLLAAIRNGMERVLLPLGNTDEWAEQDEELRSSIAVDFVETADEAFAFLFTSNAVKPPSLGVGI
ncbi:MAG: endopeptidase La [Treponema sp.]|jgi:ATP-dependent Lon protease|nr:endopeptidase La [Treponema sp.]